ncbi:MAG TPA: hypothetical protein VNR89_10990, partial [Roseomonas sp.]|nr:hypothetical protein [Roseomonas sp.]
MAVAGGSGLGEADRIAPDPATSPGYRVPAEGISHAVWLSPVFSLSLRDVELILSGRGITGTPERLRSG